MQLLDDANKMLSLWLDFMVKEINFVGFILNSLCFVILLTKDCRHSVAALGMHKKLGCHCAPGNVEQSKRILK